MARLLVEIDEDLKRELKIKLLREGKTLKTWLTESARGYLAQPIRRASPIERDATPARAAVAKTQKRFDDYLD